MIFRRDISPILKKYAKFPVIALLGPRQSGKTTLVKEIFKKYTFISFEDPDNRNFAKNDPKRFLKVHENPHGIILDEFQYVPEILSYIQLHVDEYQRPGYFVLTGSQNFLAHQAITQSLAGRVGILVLLPLSLAELIQNKLISSDVDEMMFKGGYPRVYQQDLPVTDFYSSYIQSYIERDVRLLENVGDIDTFQRFMQLCAGRVGQLLNINNLASDCGITFNTAKKWISILQASYVIFLLQPHYRNFKKRLTKSPKLYFYDTGIVCSLLKISTPITLSPHPLRGNIFENFMITDFYKQYYNIGVRPPLYFWRDNNKRFEVDCLIDEDNVLTPIEIKAGETIHSDYFKGLKSWNEISQTNPENNYIVYGGEKNQQRSNGTIIGWEKANNLIQKIRKKTSSL